MLKQVVLVLLQCIALWLGGPQVATVTADKSLLQMESLQPMISSASSSPQSALNGDLFTINSDGKIYSILFDAENSQAIIRELFLEGNASFSAETEGSGSDLYLEKSTADQQLVFDILHNHLYLAFERTIFVIFLNSSNAYQNYETISIDYDPISIQAFNYGHDPYIMTTYQTPEQRIFVGRYRKYQDENWGSFGNRVLLTSPQWNDLSRISNILVYKGFDSRNFYDSIFVIFAEDWYMYVTNLIDGTSRTYSPPEPCNNIEKFVYSEHEQRMLIQCREGTVFLDEREKEFNAFWIGVTGETYIAQNGKYGVVVNESFVTILELSDSYRSEVVSIEGLISDVAFVDASSENHYFCFVQQFSQTYRVECINIGDLLRSPSNGSNYLLSVFDSALMNLTFSNCSNLYSHRNVLTIEHIVCPSGTSTNNCSPLMQIFDMRNLQNNFNVTGLQAQLLAYKHRKYDVPTTETPTTIGVTDEPTSNYFTTVAESTTVKSVSSTIAVPTSDELEQCRVQSQEAMNNFHILLYISLSVQFLFTVLILILCILLCCAVRKIKYHGLYDPYNQATTIFRVTKRSHANPSDKVAS